MNVHVGSAQMRQAATGSAAGSTFPPSVSPDLCQLIARHEKAAADFAAICTATEALDNPSLDPTWRLASEAEELARCELLGFTPRNLADVQAQARYFEQRLTPDHGDFEGQGPVELLIRSLARIQAGAGSRPSVELQAAAADSEILAAFAEWRRAYDLSNRSGADDDYDALRATEAVVMAVVPKTARGLAIQFVIFTCFGEFVETSSAQFSLEHHMQNLASVVPPSTLRRGGGEA